FFDCAGAYFTRHPFPTRRSSDLFFEDSLYVDSLDQEGTLDAAGYRLGSSVSYTEPMGEKGMLQLNWRANYNYDDSRNETFSFNRSEEHTSELQSREKIVCRLLRE